jgi:hypothetical protein
VLVNRAGTRLHNLARGEAAAHKDQPEWPAWAQLQNAARGLVLQASTCRDLASRLLLLYDRTDFVQGDWPEELRDRVAEMTRRQQDGLQRRARVVFGHDGPEEVRRAQFVIAEVPVAAVRQHLLRHEPPPPLVDSLIRATYRAIVADYRAQKRKSEVSEQVV